MSATPPEVTPVSDPETLPLGEKTTNVVFPYCSTSTGRNRVFRRMFIEPCRFLLRLWG